MCKLATCCSAQVAKCILGAVNAVLITIGVLLAAFGAVLHFGGSFLYKLLNQALDSLSSNDVGSDIRSSVTVQDLETIVGAWMVYISYAGIALLAIGCFLVATGILGTIGACCNSKIILIVYIVIMAVLALVCVGLAVGYIVNKSQMREAGSTEMKKLLEANYKGRASANEYTNVLDLVQGRVPCCGVENVTDFDGASWNKTYILNNGTQIQLVHPVSCCKVSGSTMKPIYENCTYSPSTVNSNFMSGGCYAKLWDAFDSYSASAVYGLFIAAAVLGIIAVLALIIIINLEKDIV